MEQDQLAAFRLALKAAKTPEEITQVVTLQTKNRPDIPPPSLESLDPFERLEAMLRLTPEEFKKAKIENQSFFTEAAKMTLNPST